MSENKGPFQRVLGFIEGIFEFGERLWSIVVVGGLLTAALALYVLHLIRS